MSTGEKNTNTRTLTPGSHQADMEVKKSKFFGYAQHVETWNDAQEYLQNVRMEHPKARHVCFGFVAGTNPVQERCSDDGEPTGTAGLPILGKFESRSICNNYSLIVEGMTK